MISDILRCPHCDNVVDSNKVYTSTSLLNKNDIVSINCDECGKLFRFEFAWYLNIENVYKGEL